MALSNRRRSRQQITMMTLCLMLLLSSSSAFSLEMKYKPPVYTSVSKLRNSRFSSNADKQSKTSNRSTASYVSHPEDLLTSTDSSPSFADRMRGSVFRETQKKTTPTRTLPPNVCTVDNLQEYKRVVGEETSKVVAVRFYAPWCKACKTVQPLFYHMANKFPNVVFVDVPVTDQNANLHQGLGVTSLPFGHIYHPTGGLVEEVRMIRKNVPHFARKLQSYVRGSCELQGVGEVTSPYPSDEDSQE
jgi:thiol-disulfide isomerase/thioredoxin